MKDTGTKKLLLCQRISMTQSVQTLNRFWRGATFHRKRNKSPLLDIVTFTQHEFEVSGSCLGYRAMH